MPGSRKVRAGGRDHAAGENAASLLDFRHLFETARSTSRSRASPRSAASAEMRRIIALAQEFGVQRRAALPVFRAGFIASLHIDGGVAGRHAGRASRVDLEASPFGDWIDVKDGACACRKRPALAPIPIRR